MELGLVRVVDMARLRFDRELDRWLEGAGCSARARPSTSSTPAAPRPPPRRRRARSARSGSDAALRAPARRSALALGRPVRDLRVLEHPLRRRRCALARGHARQTGGCRRRTRRCARLRARRPASCAATLTETAALARRACCAGPSARRRCCRGSSRREKRAFRPTACAFADRRDVVADHEGQHREEHAQRRQQARARAPGRGRRCAGS